MDDIRYSEMKFLSALASQKIEYFNPTDASKFVISGRMLIEMAAALLEDLCIRFENQNHQLLIAKLRGELFAKYDIPPAGIHRHQWENPRPAVLEILGQSTLPGVQITYRGLRRIEELREVLKRDRILEDFGVLLSIRYFRKDLEDALRRSSDTAVSVLYADMDDFGGINKKFGQAAGDVVMKSYLEKVRDCVGQLGTGYRGVGDETCALIVGQDHNRAVEVAEKIRKAVEGMLCEFEGKHLPKVTTSIGVATTPPANRGPELEATAEDRKRAAKSNGKNLVISK